MNATIALATHTTWARQVKDTTACLLWIWATVQRAHGKSHRATAKAQRAHIALTVLLHDLIGACLREHPGPEAWEPYQQTQPPVLSPENGHREAIALANHREWGARLRQSAADLTAIATDTANAYGRKSDPHQDAVIARHAIDALRFELDAIAVRVHPGAPGVTSLYDAPVSVA